MQRNVYLDQLAGEIERLAKMHILYGLDRTPQFEEQKDKISKMILSQRISVREEYRSSRDRVHAFHNAPCLFCGGCEQLQENKTDCLGSLAPTCGGCLWGQGFAVCP